MNYCPLARIPEQLGWGHEKEISASALYFKKLSSKHQELTAVESGLVTKSKVALSWCFPDRIRFLSWGNTSRMQKFIIKEKPSVRNC